MLYFWNPDNSSIQGMMNLSALSTLHPFADQKKSEKYWEAVAANMCSFCWSVWRLQYQKFQSEISIFETLFRHTHPLKSFIVWKFRSYRGTILSRTILTFQSLHCYGTTSSKYRRSFVSFVLRMFVAQILWDRKEDSFFFLRMGSLQFMRTDIFWGCPVLLALSIWYHL